MAEEIIYTINLDTNKMQTNLSNLNLEINELTESTKSLTSEQKQLEKEGNKNSEQYKKNNEQIVRNKEQLKSLKTEYSDQSKVLKNSNKLKSEESGHLEKVKSELALVTRNINKMSKAQLEDNKIGGAAIRKQKQLSDELKRTEEKGGNFTRSVGNYKKATEGMGMAAGTAEKGMSMMGGVVGKLPMIFKTATTGVKAFFTALLANPIGLILTAIVALIAVAVAVLSKFQPIVDWVSDKFAYLQGLIDGFVNAMQNIGDVIKDVFSGNFSKASEDIKKMGKQMLDTAAAAEKLHKAVREYGIQQKLNEGTTAEMASKQAKLLALYKDESKSNEKRMEALKKYFTEAKNEANDDYENQKNLYNAKINYYRAEKQMQLENAHLTLKNADEIHKARELGILTDEEYKELMKQRIDLKNQEAKVDEINAKQAKQANTIRTRAISDEIALLKEKLKYYKATHQSIIKDNKHLTQEMIDEETKRLEIIQRKRIQEARKEFESIKKNYDKDSDKYIAAQYKLSTSIINIKKETNEKIIENEKKLTEQKINELNQHLLFYKEMNHQILKDTNISSQEELDSTLKIYKNIKDQSLKIIEDKSKKEKWSAEKLATEKLKIENKFIDDKERLEKNLKSNQNKQNDELIKNKKKITNLLKSIDKEYNKNLVLSNKETYDKINNNIINEYNKRIIELKNFLKDGKITQEQYDEYILKSEKDKNEKLKQNDENYYDSKLQKAQNYINNLKNLSKMFIDFNNSLSDLEIQKEKNKYGKINKEAKNTYNYKKELLKKQYHDGLITQSKYNSELNKLKNNFDKEQKKRDEKLEKSENESKKKAFDKNKKFQEANVIMSTAQAIIGTWAGYAKMGIPGTIMAAIQTALIAATGAIQLSKIQSTQYVAAGGGILDGPLHSEGGINLGNVEAEGGEFIINRASTKRYEPLLNSINNAGNTNGDDENTSDIIDYDKLAAAIQSKKVYVVSHEITDQQSEDAEIVDRSEF